MFKKIIYFIIFINTLIPCAVCYGAPDDPVTLGVNKAILFLLFVIVFVSLMCASVTKFSLFILKLFYITF